MFVCPFSKVPIEKNRFGMKVVMMYGVNSHGKNQVYGIGFLNEEYDEL